MRVLKHVNRGRQNRIAIVLLQMGGMSRKETAALLGISVGAVEQYVGRIRRAMGSEPWQIAKKVLTVRQGDWGI